MSTNFSDTLIFVNLFLFLSTYFYFCQPIFRTFDFCQPIFYFCQPNFLPFEFCQPIYFHLIFVNLFCTRHFCKKFLATHISPHPLQRPSQIIRSPPLSSLATSHTPRYSIHKLSKSPQTPQIYPPRDSYGKFINKNREFTLHQLQIRIDTPPSNTRSPPLEGLTQQ